MLQEICHARHPRHRADRPTAVAETPPESCLAAFTFDIWLSDFGANALVRFDPDTESFAVAPLPDANAQVRQLLGRPGEVWGAESGADALVVVRSICG